MSEAENVTLEVEDAKKKAIRDYCAEMSASMSRRQAEGTFQNEATALLMEKFEGLDKKILRKMAKVYHASNFQSVIEADEAFQLEYIKVHGSPE
jgi:hypothetical protein